MDQSLLLTKVTLLWCTTKRNNYCGRSFGVELTVSTRPPVQTTTNEVPGLDVQSWTSVPERDSGRRVWPTVTPQVTGPEGGPVCGGREWHVSPPKRRGKDSRRQRVSAGRPHPMPTHPPLIVSFVAPNCVWFRMNLSVTPFVTPWGSDGEVVPRWDCKLLVICFYTPVDRLVL